MIKGALLCVVGLLFGEQDLSCVCLMVGSLCFQQSLAPADLSAAFPSWFRLKPIRSTTACCGAFSVCWDPAACTCMSFSALTTHSASESACWKGLSMAKGMCGRLPSFFPHAVTDLHLCPDCIPHRCGSPQSWPSA